jgi:hypothetical protein
MMSTELPTPQPPYDPESIWLHMQAHFQKRINNPKHVEMEDYLKVHMSQDDFNFFSEMCKIQDDFTSWMAQNKMKIDPPFLLTDEKYLKRWRELSRIRLQVVSEELKKISLPLTEDTLPEEEPDKQV